PLAGLLSHQLPQLRRRLRVVPCPGFDLLALVPLDGFSLPFVVEKICRRCGPPMLIRFVAVPCRAAAPKRRRRHVLCVSARVCSTRVLHDPPAFATLNLLFWDTYAPVLRHCG